MLDTSARLLRLLSLFQTQRYWTGHDLSGRLSVTPRTLRRDVDRLRSLGYPVGSTPGAAGGYQLSAGSTLPPLLLDDDEAVAVSVGLRTGASGTVSGIEEASVRAMAKLEQVLPARLRERVTALHAFIVPLAHSGPAVDPEMLALIAGACHDCRKIQFRYKTREGSSSVREVEPHRLVYTGSRWYLAAWDIERTDWRTFRVDRIESRPDARPRFVPREAPEGDFAAFVARSVRYTPYPVHARVTLHVSMEKAMERIPMGVGTLEAIDAQRCRLEVRSASLNSLPFYLALTGFDFEVHEPPELIERVQRLAEMFRRAGQATTETERSPLAEADPPGKAPGKY